MLEILKYFDEKTIVFFNNYASPSSREAYRDRQLTTNFELKFFVCRHVSMWGFQNRVCLSIRLSAHLSVPREKKSPWLRQYQSYISNWYIYGKVFTSTTPWKPNFFFIKVRNSNLDLWRRAEITLASSISVVHWQLIHQWKGLHEYYNMETRKCEFIKIKVAKEGKNSSVRRHFPRLYIEVA